MVTAEEELAELKQEKYESEKRERYVSHLMLAGMVGMLLGLGLGMYVGYIQGQTAVWEMMKSMMLYGGI